MCRCRAHHRSRCLTTTTGCENGEPMVGPSNGSVASFERPHPRCAQHWLPRGFPPSCHPPSPSCTTTTGYGLSSGTSPSPSWPASLVARRVQRRTLHDVLACHHGDARLDPSVSTRLLGWHSNSKCTATTTSPARSGCSVKIIARAVRQHHLGGVAQQRRRFHQLYDDGWLRSALDTQSQVQIAQRLGCSPHTVRAAKRRLALSKCD